MEDAQKQHSDGIEVTHRAENTGDEVHLFPFYGEEEAHSNVPDCPCDPTRETGQVFPTYTHQRLLSQSG